MSFTERQTSETAARLVAAVARRAKEAIGVMKDATRETHADVWNGEITPEEFFAEAGNDGAEAVALHVAAVTFVATVEAIMTTGTPEEKQAAAAAVVDEFAPPRELTVNQETGVVTVAP